MKSWRPYFFSTIQCWQQVLRVVIALALAIVIAGYSPLGPEAFWVLLCTVLLLPTSIGHSQRQRLKSILIAGGSTFVLVSLSSIIGQSWIWSGLWLALIVWVAMIVAGRNYAARTNALMVIILAIIATGLPLPVDAVLARGITVIIAMLIVMLVSFIWRTKPLLLFHTRLRGLWVALLELYQQQMSALITANYYEKPRRVERTLQYQRALVLELSNSVDQLWHEQWWQQAVDNQEKTRLQTLLTQTERLRHIIIASGNLRHHYRSAEPLQPYIKPVQEINFAVEQILKAMISGVHQKSFSLSIDELKRGINHLHETVADVIESAKSNVLEVEFKPYNDSFSDEFESDAGFSLYAWQFLLEQLVQTCEKLERAA